MRSRLEADYAAHFERIGGPDGFEWEYEPRCFAGPDDQWLPDFRWRITPIVGRLPVDPPWVYTEVKPVPDDPAWLVKVFDRIPAILRKMSVIWLSEPDAQLSLVFWRYGAIEAPLTLDGRPVSDAAPWRSALSHVWEVQMGDLPPLLYPPWLYGEQLPESPEPPEPPIDLSWTPPWEQPAPDTNERGAALARAALAEAAARRPITEPRADSAQKTQIQDGLRALGLGPNDDAASECRQLMSAWISRTLTGWDDLSAREASTIIERIGELLTTAATPPKEAADVVQGR